MQPVHQSESSILCRDVRLCIFMHSVSAAWEQHIEGAHTVTAQCSAAPHIAEQYRLIPDKMYYQLGQYIFTHFIVLLTLTHFIGPFSRGSDSPSGHLFFKIHLPATAMNRNYSSGGTCLLTEQETSENNGRMYETLQLRPPAAAFQHGAVRVDISLATTSSSWGGRVKSSEQRYGWMS